MKPKRQDKLAVFKGFDQRFDEVRRRFEAQRGLSPSDMKTEFESREQAALELFEGHAQTAKQDFALESQRLAQRFASQRNALGDMAERLEEAHDRLHQGSQLVHEVMGGFPSGDVLSRLGCQLTEGNDEPDDERR